MLRWLAVLAACGGHPAAPPRDGALDAAACEPPVTVDAGADISPQCTAAGVPGSCIDVATCYGSRTATAGACSGPANIECCTPRYAIACDPDAIPQPNACLTEEPGEQGCPGGMLRVGTFCIDRFEAALVVAS